MHSGNTLRSFIPDLGRHLATPYLGACPAAACEKRFRHTSSSAVGIAGTKYPVCFCCCSVARLRFRSTGCFAYGEPFSLLSARAWWLARHHRPCTTVSLSFTRLCEIRNYDLQSIARFKLQVVAARSLRANVKLSAPRRQFMQS